MSEVWLGTWSVKDIVATSRLAPRDGPPSSGWPAASGRARRRCPTTTSTPGTRGSPPPRRARRGDVLLEFDSRTSTSCTRGPRSRRPLPRPQDGVEIVTATARTTTASTPSRSAPGESRAGYRGSPRLPRRLERGAMSGALISLAGLAIPRPLPGGSELGLSVGSTLGLSAGSVAGGESASRRGAVEVPARGAGAASESG